MLKRLMLLLLLVPFLVGASPVPTEQTLTQIGTNYVSALNRSDVDALLKLTVQPFWLEGAASSRAETKLFFQEAFPDDVRAYQILNADMSFDQIQQLARGVYRELNMQGFTPAHTRIMVIGQPNGRSELHFLVLQQVNGSWRLKGLRSCVCKRVYAALQVN